MLKVNVQYLEHLQIYIYYSRICTISRSLFKLKQFFDIDYVQKVTFSLCLISFMEACTQTTMVSNLWTPLYFQYVICYDIPLLLKHVFSHLTVLHEGLIAGDVAYWLLMLCSQYIFKEKKSKCKAVLLENAEWVTILKTSPNALQTKASPDDDFH